MLEPSPRLKKEASRLGCDPNHIIMADLILCGYTEVEAYDIAYSESLALAAKQRIANREKEYASEGFKRAYEEKRANRRNVSEAVEYRDKETVAKELNTLISTTADPKLKAELLMKLADLQQMKKDLASDSDDVVNFYLPISCEKCPLLVAYNAFIERKNKMLKPDETDKTEPPVRPDEMQRIMETVYNEVKQHR